MRLIDALELKRSISVSVLIVDGKHIFDIIDEQPTIEPERKKGKWIEQDDAWDGVYYECSVCKEPFTLIDGTPSDNLYNFCPNCGADMRGDDDE